VRWATAVVMVRVTFPDYGPRRADGPPRPRPQAGVGILCLDPRRWIPQTGRPTGNFRRSSPAPRARLQLPAPLAIAPAWPCSVRRAGARFGNSSEIDQSRLDPYGVNPYFPAAQSTPLWQRVSLRHVLLFRAAGRRQGCRRRLSDPDTWRHFNLPIAPGNSLSPPPPWDSLFPGFSISGRKMRSILSAKRHGATRALRQRITGRRRMGQIALKYDGL
jgi:hypothetical protein